MNRYCECCMLPIRETDRICPHCGKNPAAKNTEHMLAPGTLLRGRYLLGAALGQGGFGITYIGRDVLLNRRVAVKEFYPTGYAYRNHVVSNTVTTTGSGGEFFQEGKRKFLHEAQILARFVEEPGIVSVHDFFEENNTAYIVMEYLDGITLKQCVATKGIIPAKDLIPAVLPLMRALGKVHAQGIIHRDISPDNIMVLEGGFLKLLDFGAAREVGGDKSLSVMLKPGYAPEEQYRSKGRQGPWTDVYALCATLYFCLTGVRPEESVERAMNPRNTLRRPSELGAKISREQENVLQKGLAVRASDRYQSMEALASALTHGDVQPARPAIKSGAASGAQAMPDDGEDLTVMAHRPEVPAGAYGAEPSDDAELTVMSGATEIPNLTMSPAAVGAGMTSMPAQQEEESYFPPPKKKKKPLWAGAVALAALALVGFLVFSRLGKDRTAGESIPAVQTAEFSAAPEAAVEPAPTPEATQKPLTAEEQAYLDAEALLAQGKKAAAALAFHKLGDYADAAERSRAAWLEAAVHSHIASGEKFSIGVLYDGTVIRTGNSVPSMKDVIAVAAGGYHALYLLSDGRVSSTGLNSHGVTDVSDWQDIISISCGEDHAVGLRSDGTVVSSGDSSFNRREVDDWTDIVAISAGEMHTVGLRSDGTVIAVGQNSNGQCDVSDWTDIVAICAGRWHTVGIRADGTCVAAGWNRDGQCDVSEWTDIVSVCAGEYHTIGLKEDGTCVSAGWNKSGQMDVGGWSGITELCAGQFHTIGVRGDGTCVATGYNEFGTCEVDDWTGIGLGAA